MRIIFGYRLPERETCCILSVNQLSHPYFFVKDHTPYHSLAKHFVLHRPVSQGSYRPENGISILTDLCIQKIRTDSKHSLRFFRMCSFTSCIQPYGYSINFYKRMIKRLSNMLWKAVLSYPFRCPKKSFLISVPDHLHPAAVYELCSSII